MEVLVWITSRCLLPGVPTSGKESLGKNMKFTLVAKTMQAFAFFSFVNEQCSLSVLPVNFAPQASK